MEKYSTILMVDTLLLGKKNNSILKSGFIILTYNIFARYKDNITL